MNTQTGLTIILISILLVPLGLNLNTAKADSKGPLVMNDGVTLYSPVNTTYSSNSLSLHLTFGYGGVPFTINYSVDGINEGPISLMSTDSSIGFKMIRLEEGLVQLPELSVGSHRLTIYLEAYLTDYHGGGAPGAPFKETPPESANWVATWVNTVDFTIDSNGINSKASKPNQTLPNITNLSMENQTYNSTAAIPINFSVDKSITQAAYSLDGQTNVTIAGNTTLTGLPTGAHNVTVYAWDNAGNVGACQTFYFDVSQSVSPGVQSSQAFPMTWVLAALASFTVAAALAFLFFLRKNKR